MILRNTERRRDVDRLGFTLMEILVVVAILLVLVGASSIAVFKYFEDSKYDRANMDVRTLDMAVKTYTLRNQGQPPENLEAVLKYVEGGAESNLTDPWGNRYIMEMQDNNGQQTLVVYTRGPDGTVISSLKRQ